MFLQFLYINYNFANCKQKERKNIKKKKTNTFSYILVFAKKKFHKKKEKKSWIKKDKERENYINKNNEKVVKRRSKEVK